MARVAMLLTNRFTNDARVEREAGTLARMGHTVRIFALQPGDLPATEDRDGWTVERHAEPAWLGWTGVRRLVPLLGWYDRYAFLADAAAAWKPDVVHGHDLETLVPAGRLARRLGVPHVHDDHELGLEKLGQGMSELLRGPRRRAMDAITAWLRFRGRAHERRWIARARALVTACPMYGAVLEERYGRKPVILCNTPWRSDLPPDPRLRTAAGLEPDTRIALYQGTITPAGGAEHCIRAARDFPAGWALVFLGVTWMRGRLEALASEQGVEDRVRFVAPVPPAVLPGYTRAADLGLAPIRPLNKGQAYSLANKLFEYLHAGLLIVSSDIPAQGGMVRDLDAGIVLDAVTPEAIAAAVGTLAAMPEAERAAHRDRLRTLAREQWSWEVEERKLQRLYEEITA